MSYVTVRACVIRPDVGCLVSEKKDVAEGRNLLSLWLTFANRKLDLFGGSLHLQSTFFFSISAILFLPRFFFYLSVLFSHCAKLSLKVMKHSRTFAIK